MKREKLTPEEIERLKTAYNLNKDLIDKVESANAVVIGEKEVKSAVVVPSLRKSGNKLTSHVLTRTPENRLISNLVVSSVQQIDEKTIFEDLRFSADRSRAWRKIQFMESYNVAPEKCYAIPHNYHASQTIPGQAVSLLEVMKRYEAGVPTTDNTDRYSWDSELEYDGHAIIDEHNWYKLGGLKYKDFCEVPTAYQKAYDSHNNVD